MACITARVGGWIVGATWARPGRNFAHMLDLYPQQVVKAHAEDIWQRSSVSLETSGVPADWKQNGFDLSYIFDQAMRWHATRRWAGWDWCGGG